MSLFRNLLIEKKRKPYYCEVEYLESIGTQWLDIGTNINTSIDEIELYFQLTETEKYKWIFGEHDTDARLGLGSGDGTNLRNVAYYNNTYKVNDTEMYNSQHYFKSDSTGVYLNGTKIANYSNFSSTSTLYLFNLNLSSSNYMAKGKIWTFRQKRNGALIRDLIPVLDWSYVPCMYDRVSRKLFYNQGTGTFSYGREIHYTEWLESTGTQYISSGIYLTNNHSVEIDYQLTSASQSRKGIYGGLVTNGSRHGALLSPSNQNLEAGYGSGNDYYQIGYPDTNRHVLKQEKNKLYFDGNLVHTFNNATFTQNFIAPLGNFNYTNYNPASAKYYGSKWRDGDTLIRDYKPAIDENGLGFWFDKITHTCFLNAGTGDFKYAPVECEYLEVTDLGSAGSRPCIDLGIKYKSSMSIEGKYTRTAMGDAGSVLPLSTSTTNPVLYLPALTANGTTDRFVWRRGGYSEQNYFYNFSNYPLTINFKLDAVNDALYVNGSKVKTGMIAGMNGYSSPYESASNLYMLSIDGNYGGMGEVYPLKIYDTTQVYRDLIPARKDGSCGMYDKEHDVFYSNYKSGTIVCGKVVESRWF